MPIHVIEFYISYGYNTIVNILIVNASFESVNKDIHLFIYFI